MKTRNPLTSLAIYVPLTVFSVITIIPFVYMICGSFKTRSAYMSSPFYPIHDHWWEVNWGGLTLSNFTRLFEEAGMGRALLNSFFYASATCVLATLCAAMGGYALSMYRFRGRTVITTIVLLALVIPGALLLAPGYKLLYWFGLLDSYAGLILPGLAPAFGVYLFRQSFLSSMPGELIEAGRIDGCSELRIFFQLALPMVRPMIGAFILLTYLAAWNNFIQPQIVLQTAEKYPMAVAVAQLRGPYSIERGMIMAGTLVGVAPVLVLFLVFQKDFISGLASGAVKG